MNKIKVFLKGIFLFWGILLIYSCNEKEINPPTSLTVCEGFKDPLGFYNANPCFSWKLPQDGSVSKQSSYRIVVGTDSGRLKKNADLWDSGEIQSDQSTWIPYEGKPLNSRQRVYWKVQYRDERGRLSKWSKSAFFELGLLTSSDWKGEWIRMIGDNVYDPPQLWAEDDTSTHRKDAEFKIESAVYGILDEPGRTIDVTESIRQMVKHKNFILIVSDDLARDAALPEGDLKLFIDYHVNGKNVRRILSKGDKFDMFSRIDYVTLIPEYIRKEFSLGSQIAKARLYVTARGLFEVYLNGTKIGDEFMTPGWTSYRSWIETLTYDVTDHLNIGDNVIGALLGEGWYAGRIGCPGKYTDTYPEFLCQLEITLDNGEEVIIISDDTWKATNKGPVRLSSIFDGEVYDARMEMPDWDKPGYDDSDWSDVSASQIDPGIALVPKEHNPVRITQYVRPLRVTEPQPGKYTFDLGQNIVGWPILTIPVKKGETIKVRFAEMLKDDGTIYTENYRTARSTDYYTASEDGTITWHPVMTFHGFRYVELSGFPRGTQVQADWVSGAVLHSDFRRIGQFSSSHEKLNRLNENIIWGQRGNFLDIPTDCPQRDERQGWTGDAQVFCPTSMFNYNVHAFWASWMRSIRANQNSDGMIPWVVPFAGDFKKIPSPGWEDAAVIIPWEVYVRTGDPSILRNNYDMMQRWVSTYYTDARDLIVSRDGFGDWLQPCNEASLSEDRGILKGATSFDLIATAYFGYCTNLMQKISEVLGYGEDAIYYKDQHTEIQKAFSREFFDQSGKLTTDYETQTGYLMALGFDLLKPELRQGAVNNLLRVVREADGNLRTGFLGTPLLPIVIDQEGYPGISYSILFKETYPSWFYSINQGATTMWERWNSYSLKDGFGDFTMNSFNHYAYGAIGQWMYERIAGLAPDPEHPGYKHFFIQPLPGGPLSYAKAELETPYGKAISGWEGSGTSLTIMAMVPPNTTATLVVPVRDTGNLKLTESGNPCQLVEKDGRFIYEVNPGEYLFKVEYE